MKPECVPRSLPVIVWVLFKNQWNFSTLFPLWFPLYMNQYVILRALHIVWKVPLKVLPSLITMTAHVPKFKNTSSINIFAIFSAVMLYVGVETTNCVRMHITFIKCPLLPVESNIYPGHHISICMIQNGVVMGQEKYSSILQFLKKLYVVQWAQLWTHNLISLRIFGQ